MEPFDYDESFKPIMRMLKRTGSWPESNASLAYRILGYFCILIMVASSATCILTLFTKFADSDSVIYAPCFTLSIFHSVVKVTVLRVNKSKFFKLMGMLKDPLFASHGNLNVYIKNKVRTAHMGRLSMHYPTMGTCAFVVFSHAFTVTERSLPAPFPMDMKQQSITVYLAVWCLQGAGTFLSGFTTPSYDGLVVLLMCIAAAQLRILREKIEHSTDIDSSDSQPLKVAQDRDRLINDRLRDCVTHHIAIDRYIKSIEDMFLISFMIQILMSVIIVAFLGFNCVITPVSSPNFGRGVVFLTATAVELTLFCVPGNEIILQSEKLREACYMSEWTDCGFSVRKSLFIIMERSKRPLSLTAAKLVVLSLDSLLSVTKSTFSYFTVLRRVYADSS